MKAELDFEGKNIPEALIPVLKEFDSVCIALFDAMHEHVEEFPMDDTEASSIGILLNVALADVVDSWKVVHSILALSLHEQIELMESASGKKHNEVARDVMTNHLVSMLEDYVKEN